MQHFLEVANDLRGYNDIFIDLRRIDIDLKDLCIFRERLRIAGHTVAETGAQHDQKVALADAVVGRLCPVHAEHAGVARIGSGECAFPHQGIGHRRIQLIHKLPELPAGAGQYRTAAHEHEGAL